MQMENNVLEVPPMPPVGFFAISYSVPNAIQGKSQNLINSLKISSQILFLDSSAYGSWRVGNLYGTSQKIFLAALNRENIIISSFN